MQLWPSACYFPSAYRVSKSKTRYTSDVSINLTVLAPPLELPYRRKEVEDCFNTLLGSAKLVEMCLRNVRVRSCSTGLRERDKDSNGGAIFQRHLHFLEAFDGCSEAFRPAC